MGEHGIALSNSSILCQRKIMMISNFEAEILPVEKTKGTDSIYTQP